MRKVSAQENTTFSFSTNPLLYHSPQNGLIHCFHQDLCFMRKIAVNSKAKVDGKLLQPTKYGNEKKE